jgi:hypothetical protein
VKIIVENCSSPGASFTENTNEVIIKIYEWIQENKEPKLSFIHFRRRLESEKGINDNNARNIYPLLKNCKFVEYEGGTELNSKSFFTNRGLAYVKAQMTLNSIMDANYEKKQKEFAKKKFDTIIEQLVLEGVKSLMKMPDLNYTKSIKWYLEFLIRFRKINKYEFAYLIYVKNSLGEDCFDDMSETINNYRMKKIEIEVQVRVRNDIKIKEKTGEESRLEDIGFLTSYSFYSGLLTQAGLIIKVGKYNVLIQTQEENVKALLEV